MAATVAAEAHALPVDTNRALCQRLVDAFNASLENEEPSEFLETLEAVLAQVVASGDDVYVWQAALSVLGDRLDQMPESALYLGRELLDRARATIGATMQRQFRQHVVDQRWMLNRLGTLSARLLASLDEAQIYEVLAQHLPAMGVHTTWLALFNAEGDDPTARTTLRDLMLLNRPELSFSSRDFPPRGMLPTGEQFSLALFPLTGPRGQLGYAVYDTERIDLYGAITQELATALTSAQLHREATEGRRLAEEANELKSHFLSTVSHELRTPLNMIVGLSGILLEEAGEDDTPLPEPYRQDVERIYASAQHLSGLIGDVLDLASSDAGHLRLAYEFVDLGEALGLTAETGRQLAQAKGLGWHAALPESGPWVWGDRTRLRQIVLNLVNNAVKFTPRGQVRLNLQSGVDSVSVEVSDTGLGIPPEEQSLIFHEFRRTERSISHDRGGLGLGLAICQRLVELHGGAIGVRSSGEEGAGSTFYFTLPTVQPPASQVQYQTTSSLSEERVMVLTHSAGSGQRLHDHLAERGYDVWTALTDQAPDWLSRLVVSPPGAVVVDMSAEAHRGWAVLKAIKGHPKTQHLPVLFYSLSPDGGSVQEFDYLTKPIELADLTRALDRHWLLPETDRDAKTVLVADDDPNTLEMHARIVQAHSTSHCVLTARNGREALDILRREHVDLVLLDLVMPELDGFGVLKAMRERESTRETPVIVLTGQVLTERDMARLNRGVATVLSKGLFSMDETLTHVDAALERNRRLSREAQRLVRQAMAYIHQHYAESISRADLAQNVALSEDYLTACFRNELGVTPIAYLNRYRVHRARQLLATTGKSVTEIALEVGFSDSGYFSRVFRREVGLSPEAYRQS
jgi:signal transduction histidine kinase/AraC-like DNA-binding protein/DNA-binding LytR/AlgR family response regulator